MRRRSLFALKGRIYISPGRKPWVEWHFGGRALKERINDDDAPFQGAGSGFVIANPGLRPGLI